MMVVLNKLQRREYLYLAGCIVEAGATVLACIHLLIMDRVNIKTLCIINIEIAPYFLVAAFTVSVVAKQHESRPMILCLDA
jgi:hypothetical protein